jgi:predicted transglutaminase-like cysteine proteinase
MFPPDGKGDCEDYVLTKLGLLSMAGFPMVNDTKVVGVIVHLKSGGEGHAILAIRLPSKAVLYMDNRFSEPMTRQELVARGYEFFDWKA